ncbi:unnamed protein product [Cylindrotheca closterium]|uniref:Uncharacterized protein n=1 Tax=Cylindrotheca closterium TaxID=2856 RepID=A0AAD2PXG7_9STRA|nr:unnamed protein product [Cylindrotheca closterium]
MNLGAYPHTNCVSGVPPHSKRCRVDVGGYHEAFLLNDIGTVNPTSRADVMLNIFDKYTTGISRSRFTLTVYSVDESASSGEVEIFSANDICTEPFSDLTVSADFLSFAIALSGSTCSSGPHIQCSPVNTVYKDCLGYDFIACAVDIDNTAPTSSTTATASSARVSLGVSGGN